jgi:hypothetical protein
MIEGELPSLSVKCCVFDRGLYGRDPIDLDKIAPSCKIGLDFGMKCCGDCDINVEQRELGWIE